MRDYALETTFDLKFTSRRFTTGVPFALASGVVSAYPGNSTTQLTAGITLTADFDTVTGLNNVRVVATAANGYATNTNYALVITTGTVDSVSVVGEVIGEFSIEAQSPLRPTVAGRTLDVSATGEGGLDWANIGSPTTAQNLSATNIDVDQIVASVSGAVGSVTGLTAATVHTDLDDIQARLPAALVSGRMDASVGAIAANAITAASIATDAIGAAELAADAVAEIADQVWDEILGGHVGAGSTGEALGAAGAAGDPWITALPGAYGAGSAGKIVGDNLNATVSSRASQTTVDTIDDFLDTEVAAIKAKTDQLVFTVANRVDASSESAGVVLTAAERNSIADALLNRDMATGTDSGSTSVRTVRQALRFLRNKWSISGTTLTVCKEDDTTTTWTSVLGTTVGADPVTSTDPAGP